jgi:citrate synthase
MAASGNRQSPSVAVAAGVLAIGDEHGGVGSARTEMIAAGVELAQRESISVDAAARQIIADALANKKRLPGLGRRVHSTDPRKAVLFGSERKCEGVSLKSRN